MAIYTEKRSRRKSWLAVRLLRLAFVGVLAAAAGWGVTQIVGPPKKVSGDAASPEASAPVHIEIPDWVTADLLPVNAYSRPGTKLTAVNAVVIHYVGNPKTTAAQNRSFYENLAETHETKASSNFLVGMDGEILECVPVDEVAYCSNIRNEDSISIECCHPDKTGKFTDATYKSLVRLTAFLCRSYGLDATNVIRHYDITKKECPKYFVDYKDAWDTFRRDVQRALDAPEEETQKPGQRSYDRLAPVIPIIQRRPATEISYKRPSAARPRTA